MRKVAELDRYVLALYIKGMQRGDFSDLYALLLGETQENTTSQVPDFIAGFFASSRHRRPKWNRPEGFKPYYKVDWRRYWKWKGTEVPATELKKKRKWWIRWGKWDGLNGKNDVKGIAASERSVRNSSFKRVKTTGSPRVARVTLEMSIHLPADLPATPCLSVMTQETSKNFRFQCDFRRAA
jgi:hypothetical protein